MGYYQLPTIRRGSIIGNAAVLKTAARKGLQVRVLSPQPLTFRIAHLGLRMQENLRTARSIPIQLLGNPSDVAVDRGQTIQPMTVLLGSAPTVTSDL